MANNDNNNAIISSTVKVMPSPLSSPLLHPSKPFSAVRTATITHVLMAVLRCAPAWIQLAPVEAARKGVSVTPASNSVGESVSQQRTVGAGIMENTMR